MKKKLVRVVLALVLLVIIAVSLAIVYIDVIAKTAIEVRSVFAGPLTPLKNGCVCSQMVTRS